MASSQQGARNMRQKSVDDQPLTDSEVRMTTGLLYRAVCHGQAQAVIQTYRASVIPKRFQVGAVSLMNDVQMFTGLANCAKEIHATQSAQLQTVSGESMTDAAKRRLDPESPHSLTESVWEELAASNAESPPMHYKISSGYPVPMPGYGDFPPSNEVSYVNHKIKIPEDGMTFEQWGHTICINGQGESLGVELRWPHQVCQARFRDRALPWVDCEHLWIEGHWPGQRKDHPCSRPCFVFRSFRLACGEPIPIVSGDIHQDIERLKKNLKEKDSMLEVRMEGVFKSSLQPDVLQLIALPRTCSIQFIP